MNFTEYELMAAALLFAIVTLTLSIVGICWSFKNKLDKAGEIKSDKDYNDKTKR